MDKPTSDSLKFWLDYSAEQIKERVNADAKALSLFSEHSNLILGDIPCWNCGEWRSKIDLFKKIISEMTDSGYRLKKMYNGIRGVYNESITVKQAKDLIKNHPRGEGLFDVIPEKKERKSNDSEDNS